MLKKTLLFILIASLIAPGAAFCADKETTTLPDATGLAKIHVVWVVIGGELYKTTIDDVLGLIEEGHLPAAMATDAEVAAAIAAASLVAVTEDCSGYTEAGHLCWDSNDRRLYIGDSSTAVNVWPHPFIEPRTISAPTDADDYHLLRAPAALVLSAFGCIAEGTSPSITADLLECDSSGSPCVSMLSAPVTCNGGWDAGTLTDTAVAENAVLRVQLGAPSGTVAAVTVQVEGSR